MFEYEEENFPEKATLCYIFDDSEILMIEKKKGHGEGKIVGPGGVVEEYDPTVRHAATRETVEETAVVPYGLEKVGEMGMVFEGQPFQHIDIFTASGYLGQPQETVEGLPDWYDIRDLPYDSMWDADRKWMPEMINERGFKAEFFFNDEKELKESVLQPREF